MSEDTQNEPAAPKPKTSSKAKRNYLVAGLSALLLLGVAAPSFIQKPVDFTQSSIPVPEATSLDDVDYSHIEDVALGNPSAPVTIVEYASFTCSHCVNFSQNVFPDLKKDFIDTGEVRFIMREVITHPVGLWGSLLARCEGTDSYYPIAKDIFGSFDAWTKVKGPQDIIDRMITIGADHDLSEDAVDACLNNEDEAKALLARSQGLGQDDDIKGTPTFIINGKTVQNAPYEDLKNEITLAIAQAEQK